MSEKLLTDGDHSEESIEVAQGIRLPSVERMDEVWNEFTARHDHFKHLILSRLQQGRDYGFPPGCECKFDGHGNVLQFNRKTGQHVAVPRSQWQAKPSLYLEGAHALRDLFKMLGYPVRSEFTLVEHSGGNFIFRCELFHEVTGQKVGEALGAYTVGQNRQDENGAIQMAQNRAFKSAIRRTLPCVQSLFTQDTEDLAQGKPSASANAAPSSDEFGALVAAWLVEIVAGSPLEGYELSDEDIKSLKAKIKLWTAPTYPANAQEAIEWCRSHVNVRAMEDQNGQITGIKFVKAHK